MAAAEQRKRDAYRRAPALLRAQQKKNALLLAGLRRAMTEGGAAYQKEELARCDEEIARVAREAGVDLSLMEFQPLCARCGDTGFVNTAEGRVFCGCLLRRIYEECFGAAPLSSLASFADFDETLFPETAEDGTAQREQMRGTRALLEQYAGAFSDSPVKTVLLTGQAGLGKSFLLECMARRMAEQTEKVLLLPAFTLFSLFHEDRLGERRDLDLIFDAQALLIDDLGMEPMTQNVTREYFFRLLEYRRAAGLPTLMTTNLNLAQLKERYFEKITSRLCDAKSGWVFRLAGDDIRLGR